MGFEWAWDSIEWVAVIVAVVANMALGFLWYSKIAFLTFGPPVSRQISRGTSGPVTLHGWGGRRNFSRGDLGLRPPPHSNILALAVSQKI